MDNRLLTHRIFGSRAQRYTPRSQSSFVLLAILFLSGCQSFSLNAPSPQIRIIDASPDAPMLDVYRGPAALSYNLAFGNITSYVAAAPGANDLSLNVSGSRQVLALAHGSLSPAAQYTLIVGGTSATLQPSLLLDQTAPAPPGQVALRFVNQVNAEGTLDIYLVPSGVSTSAVPPILQSQPYAANSGYLNLPAGSYRVVIYPAGAAPASTPRPAYSGNTISYPAGAARTIVLLDHRTPFPSPVQVIAASDFEPPATSPASTP